MCGRFALTTPPEAVRAYFDYEERPNFPARYNIAPTQPIAIVRMEFERDQGAARHFALARWGLWPSWLKDPRGFPLIFNARDDALTVKASFRGAIRHRRCLIPADGYYEWLKPPAKSREPKRPFLFRRPGGGPLAFAGLWENWLGADGSEVETACLVTTCANGRASAVHERMPAILEPKDFAIWLDHRAYAADEAAAVLKPAPDDVLEMVEVGTAVGSVAAEGPDLQKPVPARSGLQELAGNGRSLSRRAASRRVAKTEPQRPDDNLDFDF
jgi:putative SOS response-associated peptidase YedK